MADVTAQDAELARVLEVCLVAMELGSSIDPAQIGAAYPRIASRLRACLIMLKRLRQFALPLPAGVRRCPGRDERCRCRTTGFDQPD
jgi:hypothetical protein